jgi:hypothetical protein
LVCDNWRDSALSGRLHTKTYAARPSALTRLVLTDQCSSRNGVMKQTRPESMGFEKQAVQGASVRRIAEAMQGCEQRRNAPLIEAQRKGD